jgi:Zn-dependent M28 family amino/carboxypeptidase
MLMLGQSPARVNSGGLSPPRPLWYSSGLREEFDEGGTMNVRKRCPALSAAAALLVLWSCQGSADRVEPVTTAEIAGHIRDLSDDLLEGRAVGTKGIEMAARYHEDYFRTMGLEPAFGTSYRQVFPLKGSRPDPLASLEISGPDVALTPVLGDEFVVRTEREDAPAEAAGDLVYAGYLIQAPERNWDDIKGADLAGKVLLVEINEPGNRPGGDFDGEDMTYYGRWVYKFEKAEELGAAGILIIHDTKGAAYGWDVLRASWGNESFYLPDRDPRVQFQGWVSGETADKLFGAVKLDRAALRAKAETADFAPVPLGLRATVRQHRTTRAVDGINVAGVVRAKHPGARKRMIILSAHYDHFGKDDTLQGDRIYNGAVDNCSASASLLALAGYYAQRPEKLKDDLTFVAVTAEEQLLLGSEYFARHMPFPASAVVADINFEMTNVWGETEDVFAIGAKYSDLDGICREAAGKLGLRYIPERNGELGFYFRSDQLSFARAGIPGVWLSQGIVSRGPDKDLVQRKFDDYRKTKYHKVSDEIQPDWDLRGTLQIIDWAREIVSLLQEAETLPQFLPTSSFKRQDVSSGPSERPSGGK